MEKSSFYLPGSLLAATSLSENQKTLCRELEQKRRFINSLTQL